DKENEIQRIVAEMEKARTAAKAAEEEAARQHSAVEKLDRQIQETAYDNELHLRLSQWAPLAHQHGERRKQIQYQEGKKALEERNLQAARDTIAAAQASLESADGQVRNAELIRASKKKDADDLRARHGSVDTIQHAISGLQKAGLVEPELAKQRGEIAK